MKGFFAGLSGLMGLVFVLLGISTIPAWITHIVVCLREDEWGFLIAGALFFPVAIVHGWGCWFGWWG